jgi:aspartyl-tRNA(Asn)/glutamyl-tRNA(Gln) amidotransferase subunit B
MEEDAGKSIHDFADGETLVDLNRCGVPLIEIVSEPELRSPEEAYNYLTTLKQLVQYLEICDANMEEGSLRCDANVSVRPKEQKIFGTKTEVKNLNSFRNVVDALNSEIKRQIDVLENGEHVIHQTLTFDAKTKKTTVMRTKEEAHDYRYFPEPDLVGIYVDEKWIDEIKSTIPELPDNKKERFISQYKIPEYNAEVLTQDKPIADYFENVCSGLENNNQFKNASNWIMTEIMRILNENKIVISRFPVKEKNISLLIRLIDEGKITNTIAKDVFLEMLKINDSDNEKQNPEYIVKTKNLLQLTDESEIENIIIKVLNENQKEVDRYLNGETKLLGMFVGKVMKESKGKANPKTVNELLVKKLK